MAHIILTGATGTAGAAILDRALKSPSISRISILSRRPVAPANHQPKARVIIHKDFENYPPEVLDQLKGATGCIWAQGISSRGIQEAQYSKITIDYPVAAAKALASLGSMNFVYMSGDGADMDEKSSLMFGRIKGRAEKTMLKLGEENDNLHVYNIRPALINPQGHYSAERAPTLHDKSSTFLGNVFERVWKSYVISTPALAEACLVLATGDGKPTQAGVGVEAGGRLLRNTALRRLGGI